MPSRSREESGQMLVFLTSLVGKLRRFFSSRKNKSEEPDTDKIENQPSADADDKAQVSHDGLDFESPEFRSLRLGIDYGTSASKLVITDHSAVGGEKSFVVRPTMDEGGDGGFRIPSVVSIENEKIGFGFHAKDSSSGASVYSSLKMLCAYPDRYYGDDVELPSEFSAQDLATLYVAYLVQLGQSAAERYASRFEAQVQLAPTLGVPMAQLDDRDISSMFLNMVREAFSLRGEINLLNEVSIGEAIRALANVRESLNNSGVQVKQERDWIRSEADAALFWATRSIEVEEGRYACVDIGAGTTSASWFHIVAESDRGQLYNDRISFYGAACAPPACDAIDMSLRATDSSSASIDDLRGRESDLIDTLSDDQLSYLKEILGEIADVFGKSFEEAYEKEPLTSAWRDRALIFFLGGGSMIEEVRHKLIESRRYWLRSDPEIDPGVPENLAEEDGSELHEEDAIFLLVAYGLAQRHGDMLKAIKPIEIPELPPQEHGSGVQRPTRDDLYPK